MKKLLTLLLSIGLFLGLLNTSFAATPKFTMQGTNTVSEITISPGTIYKDSVIIQNKDPENNITIELSSSFPEKWIRFDKTIVNLKPNTNEIVNFTVTFPTQLPIEITEQERPKYTLYSALTNWDSKNKSGGLTIQIEVGKNYFFNIVEGAPFILDYRTSAKNNILNTTQTKTFFSNLGNSISSISDKYKLPLIIVLIVIILFKIIIVKFKKKKKTKPQTKTKTNKTKKQKTKQKKSTPKK